MTVVEKLTVDGTTYDLRDAQAIPTSNIATSWTNPTTNTVPNTDLVDSRLQVCETNILSVEDMICDTEFSTSTAYAVGDYVTYNNSLYEFTSAHSAGAWDSADVTQIDVVGIIGNINSVLEAVL